MGIVHHSTTSAGSRRRVDLLEQLGYGYDRIESEGFPARYLRYRVNIRPWRALGDTVLIYAEAPTTTACVCRCTMRCAMHRQRAACAAQESHHCFMGRDSRPVSLRRSWPALDQYGISASLLKAAKKKPPNQGGFFYGLV